MQADPNGRILSGMSTLLGFIALNIIYLVTCVPIITIGVATSALFEVTFRYADEERGNLIGGYFVALRRNAKDATIVFLAFAIPIVLLTFAAVFWYQFSGPVSGAAAVLAILAIVWLLASLLFGLALVASFQNSIRRTILNALRFPGAEPLRTLGLLLIPLTCAAMLYVFRGFVILLVTLGFALGSYASSFIFRSVFRHYPQGTHVAKLTHAVGGDS